MAYVKAIKVPKYRDTALEIMMEIEMGWRSIRPADLPSGDRDWMIRGHARQQNEVPPGLRTELTA